MKSLQHIDTRAPKDLDKKQVKQETEQLIGQLYELQNLLYASSSHSVLVILQGMDASGKDGVIRKVLGRMNPQGVGVNSFKAPTDQELAHDCLWRIHLHTPAKGMIEVFNRSHYEDVLVTRVHGWCSDELAQKRFKAINHFEELLQEHNNTLIFKFYLHISKEEQTSRLAERQENPQKMWKYNSKDSVEAEKWDDYMRVYEEAIEACNKIPWQLIPSDQNWYKEYLIAKSLVEGLKGLNLKYPQLKDS